jgi:hypothetical protein
MQAYLAGAPSRTIWKHTLTIPADECDPNTSRVIGLARVQRLAPETQKEGAPLTMCWSARVGARSCVSLPRTSRHQPGAVNRTV